MPSEQQLVDALQRADAAGDHEGAQQIADMIKAQRAGDVDPSVAPTHGGPAAAPTSHDAAAQAGLQAGQDENPILAGISQAAQQATFGGQNYINAGIRWAAQRALGVKNPDSFADNLEYSRSKSAGEAGAHPVASTVGGVAGSFLGGGAIGDAVKLASKGSKVVAAGQRLLTPGSNAVANVAKSAGINGLISGGSSLAAGDDTLTAGRNAAIGAVAGPVLAKGANVAFNKLTPVAQRAMMTLAKTLDESPQVLAAANQAYTRVTGVQAPLAALTGLKSQGKLKALAAANDEIGQVAATAADIGGAPLHEQLQALQQAQQNPQTVSGMEALRDRNHSAALDQPAATTNGVPLRDAPVPITTQSRLDVLTDPLITHALNPDTRVTNSLFGPDDLHNAIATDTLTVGDLDHIRLQLRNQQAVHDSPTAGTGRNPEVAKAYGKAAQAIEAMAQSAHPAYGNAMSDYRNASRYTTGFQHAYEGKALTDAPDNFTARDLAHPIGQAGYEHGLALRKGQQALAAIAPGTVQPPKGPDVTTAIKAAHAVSAPSALSVAGILNSLQGKSLPKAAQAVVSDMLYSKDPARVQQGIANLEKYGVQSDDLRRLAGVIGGVGAERITAHLDNRDQ